MRDYSTGKIYAIRSPSTDKVYIGSTIEKLSSRMAKHRCSYKRYLNGKSKGYMTSFELLEKGNAYIELVEDYPCERKEQLLKREGGVMRVTEHCVNIKIMGRTKKEYCDEHKQEKREYDRLYRERNKDTIYTKRKTYFDSRKQEKREYDRSYRERNKDKLLTQRKTYYIQNKDKLAKSKKKKYTCVCGVELRKDGKSTHLKTQKHFQYEFQQFPFGPFA